MTRSTSGGVFSLNGQGMQPLVYEILQRIIHKAMACHAGQSREAFAGHADREMATFLGTGMAGVQVAVILDFDGRWVQGGAQGGLDPWRGHRVHCGLSADGSSAR